MLCWLKRLFAHADELGVEAARIALGGAIGGVGWPRGWRSPRSLSPSKSPVPFHKAPRRGRFWICWREPRSLAFFPTVRQTLFLSVANSNYIAKATCVRKSPAPGILSPEESERRTGNIASAAVAALVRRSENLLSCGQRPCFATVADSSISGLPIYAFKFPTFAAAIASTHLKPGVSTGAT